MDFQTQDAVQLARLDQVREAEEVWDDQRVREHMAVALQKIEEPLAPDASGINSDKAGQPTDMGRRFMLKAFRWLRPEEV